MSNNVTKIITIIFQSIKVHERRCPRPVRCFRSYSEPHSGEAGGGRQSGQMPGAWTLGISAQ